MRINTKEIFHSNNFIKFIDEHLIDLIGENIESPINFLDLDFPLAKKEFELIVVLTSINSALNELTTLNEGIKSKVQRSYESIFKSIQVTREKSELFELNFLLLWIWAMSWVYSEPKPNIAIPILDKKMTVLYNDSEFKGLLIKNSQKYASIIEEGPFTIPVLYNLKNYFTFLGEYFIVTSNTLSLISICDQGLEYAREVNDPKLVLLSLFLLSKAYYDLGEYTNYLKTTQALISYYDRYGGSEVDQLRVRYNYCFALYLLKQYTDGDNEVLRVLEENDFASAYLEAFVPIYITSLFIQSKSREAIDFLQNKVFNPFKLGSIHQFWERGMFLLNIFFYLIDNPTEKKSYLALFEDREGEFSNLRELFDLINIILSPHKELSDFQNFDELLLPLFKTETNKIVARYTLQHYIIKESVSEGNISEIKLQFVIEVYHEINKQFKEHEFPTELLHALTLENRAFFYILLNQNNHANSYLEKLKFLSSTFVPVNNFFPIAQSFLKPGVFEGKKFETVKLENKTLDSVREILETSHQLNPFGLDKLKLMVGSSSYVLNPGYKSVNPIDFWGLFSKQEEDILKKLRLLIWSGEYDECERLITHHLNITIRPALRLQIFTLKILLLTIRKKKYSSKLSLEDEFQEFFNIWFNELKSEERAVLAKVRAKELMESYEERVKYTENTQILTWMSEQFDFELSFVLLLHVINSVKNDKYNEAALMLDILYKLNNKQNLNASDEYLFWNLLRNLYENSSQRLPGISLKMIKEQILNLKQKYGFDDFNFGNLSDYFSLSDE